MGPGREIDRRDLECPYNGKPCRKRWERCAFKAVSDRTYDNGERVVVYGCSQFMVMDEVLSLSNRMAMVHKEVGETKNAAVFQAMAALTDTPAAKDELLRVVRSGFGSVSRMIGN
jgi:hypothetical protein